MDVSELFQYLWDKMIVRDYLYINAAAILTYDYLLTLHLEIKLVWLSRWSYTKILFLLIRYSSFAYVILGIYGQVSPDISVKSCKVVYPLGYWLVLLHLFFAEFILAIRTWVIWKQNRSIGFLLSAVICALVIVSCISVGKTFKLIKYIPPPYPGYKGCFAMIDGTQKLLWESYLTLTIFQAIVLALLLISAFRTYRRGDDGKLSYVIHRDGIMFYVYLFCISAATMFLTFASSASIAALLVSHVNALYTVFTTRIILNIRDEGNQGLQTEVHTDYSGTLEFAILNVVVSEEHGQTRDDPTWVQFSKRIQGRNHDDIHVP